MIKRLTRRSADNPVEPRLDGPDEPPVKLTRRQSQRYAESWLRRHELETGTVLEAIAMAAAAAPPVAEQVEEPKGPGWWSRLWDARPLFAALSLITGLLYVIIPNQVNYYRSLGGLNPEIGGVHFHTYLTVPVVTEALSAYMGLLAGYTILKNSGRYRMYLKWMWLFASIAAVVNVKNGWNVGDGTHITSFLLGGLSLAVPLVWHFYAGISLRVKHSGGVTIAELAAISRAWARHPRFSIRTARAVDLFPDLTRQEVWNMIVQKHRDELVHKWGTTREQRREQRRERVRLAELDAAAHRRAVHELAPIGTVADVQSRWLRLTSKVRREPDMNRPTESEPASTSAVQVAERPGAPVESPAETTGELRVRDFLIQAWHEQCGSHLDDAVRLDVPKRGTGAELSRVHHVTPTYVSRVFKECAAGKYVNPIAKSAQGNVNKAGE